MIVDALGRHGSVSNISYGFINIAQAFALTPTTVRKSSRFLRNPR